MVQTGTAPNTKGPRINKSRFAHKLFIEAYGVKVCIAATDAIARRVIRKMLPDFLADSYTIVNEVEVDHTFYYVWNRSAKDSLYRNGEKVSVRTARTRALRQLSSLVRLAVAEFAVGHVFVHAGVVAWKGKAIVMPAKTFEGKSTLVMELVKRGAVYYSDEYAVIDKDGRVRPFPKMISLRLVPDDRSQTDHAVESFGGVAGTESIPVGLILFTQYKPKCRWDPRPLTKGKGLIELIRDTIPIRTNPQFTLSVLKTMVENAAVIKSPRGDAEDASRLILALFESHIA
ncbi:MAG: hypothetical protein ABI791_11390 [Acidobacteriota bacterium]